LTQDQGIARSRFSGFEAGDEHMTGLPGRRVSHNLSETLRTSLRTGGGMKKLIQQRYAELKDRDRATA
jgi:hypothetical protein